MIIFKLNDGKMAIMIENKEEAIGLYTAFNREYEMYDPENVYDIDEVAAETWPKIITEDDVNDDEVGFLMWPDDFWKIIGSAQSLVDNLDNGEQVKI